MVWLSLCVALPWLVGCEGCQSNDGIQAEAELPTSPFSAQPIAPFPAGESSSEHRLKPGHWFTATIPLQSNREDERGTLQISAGRLISDQLGQQRSVSQPLLAERPVVLPKGQRKQLDFRFLAPLPEKIDSRLAYLRNRLTTRRQGLVYDSGERDIRLLRPEQYFFVVLTTRPERFVSFQVADWVKPPSDPDAFESSATPVNYRLVFPKSDDLIALPETMLDWSSTAYLLWDDVEMDRLTPGQQQAVVDWLNWGGRIIVNGRYADQTLANSLLSKRLPMTPEKLSELDGASFAEMLRAWSVENDDTTARQIALVENNTSLVGIDGPIDVATEALPGTSDLVLSRRIGLGSIVMTRFDVTTDLLKNWKSRNSFYNNLLLRRPPRQYATEEGSVEMRFADAWQGSMSSPLLNSPFRIYARDGLLRRELPDQGKANAQASPDRVPDAEIETVAANDGAEAEDRPAAVSAKPAASFDRDPLESWFTPGNVSEPLGGVGAWTDRSPVAITALDGLTQESGIAIPPASFVARSLAWYLVILVPLNYLVFRLLRRLEYAWLAVPVIAIGGAIVVARAARLDIGFARLQNEVSVLEMQPQYDRVHISNYVAIYSSLGTNYDLTFDTPDAVALPVGLLKEGVGEQTPARLQFGMAEGPILAGVPVASNRTRLIHAEQILSVGGPIAWDAAQSKLENRSTLELTDAFILRRTEEDVVQVAVLGDVATGSEQTVRFSEQAAADLADDLPLPIRELMSGLRSGRNLRPGETRLIARVPQPPSKMAIEPAASQASHHAVLIAHLEYPRLPQPKKDVNLPAPPKERVEDALLQEALDNPL